MKEITSGRILFIGVGLLGWIITYLLQDFDITKGMVIKDQFVLKVLPREMWLSFVVNKVWRFILNDGFSMLVIYGLFPDRSKLRVAFFVMCFGLFVLLPLYLFLTLYFQQEVFSVVVFLHRLTVNPLLMLLLIPAFFYQERKTDEGREGKEL